MILVKNMIFRHFPIVFYRKYSKIKRTVIPPCCTWFQWLIFCTEPSLNILEAWWKGLKGNLSFTLNSFSANDSRVCATDLWLSPLTHRERRHTVASQMERRHTETHKNTTQETHIETLRNTSIVRFHICILKQRKTVNHSFFYFDLPRAGPVPFIHQFNKKPI